METYTNNFDLPVWEHPADYAGFSPDGDFIIYSRHRDSEILTISNYERIFSDLREFAEQFETDDTESFVYDFRAGHWAVGWIETILIRKESPEQLQAKASEILAALSDYPVYDDSDYSERQRNAIVEYWTRCSIRERIEWCKDSNMSIFSARGNEIPESLEESEMFY